MSEPSAPARVRPIEHADLASVRGWRNAPAVRQAMFTQHEISPEEHERWFARLVDDPRRRALVVEDENYPIGVAQFSGVAEGGVADWGFYLAPAAKPGDGQRLGVASLDYAFDVLKLHKVCGEVLAQNDRSLRFHERLGFVREGLRREQVLVEGRYHDLVCFGLLRADYELLRRKA